MISTCVGTLLFFISEQPKLCGEMKHEFYACFLNNEANGTKVNELLGYAYVFTVAVKGK